MTITEWIEALESGKFEQTKYRLKDDSGYCCLGVACEVAGVEWGLLFRAIYKGDKRNSSINTLPIALRIELGLTEPQMSSLMHMNDSEELNFYQIAAKLREWFPQ